MPYLALPAETLRSRAIALQQDKGIFGMVFYPEADAPQGSESELEDIAADGLIDWHQQYRFHGQLHVTPARLS